MSPAPAPIVGLIQPRELCHVASTRFPLVLRESLRIGLSAISNLYCLYALDNEVPDPVRIAAFSCDRIAPRKALIGEIRRALRNSSEAQAQSILAALAQGLDHVFLANRFRRARLPGFGLLEVVNLERSEYALSVELPLATFLSAGPASIAGLRTTEA